MVGTATDSLVLIGLDFEPVLPCESLNHNALLYAPAEWIEDGICPACSVRVKKLTCTPCKDYSDYCATILHASGCGTVTRTDHWNMTWTPIKEV